MNSHPLGSWDRGAFILLVLLLLSSAVPLGCSEHRADGVVLVVVDALRPDHLGTYGYQRPTSPRLDEWAQQAAVFENAMTTSPWTLPAFGSLLTGELPARHAAGSRLRESNWTVSSRLNDEIPTLPEVLGASQFVTGAIVTNPWLPPGTGLERGFQTYDYQRPGEQDHRRADEVVDLALTWITGNAGKRFFLMVHILDPHMSYDAPPPARGRFTGELDQGFQLPVVEPRKIQKRAASVPDPEREFIRAAYDEEIAFVDQELGRFFAALRQSGLWDRLLVVVTSDHGEELFDHEGFEHGHSVYQELLRIPLLIWAPGIQPERRSDPVSLVDLPDTILDAVGVGEWQSSAGQSLWPVLVEGQKLQSRLLTAEGTLYGPERRAAIQWPLKLTVEIGTGVRRLYHLERDPDERRDLAGAEGRAVKFLSQELRNTLRAARQGVQAEDVPLDEETVRELRSLGYLN